MALIEAKGLSKIFTGEGTETVALHDVDLAIESGEFVSIMGSSGSGKSTLLHLLGLLDTPTKGNYVFNKTDTALLTQEKRAQMRNEQFGFVFQMFYLLARTTVLENVLLPLQYSSIPPSEHIARAEKALADVAMTHRLKHRPSQLSGGEKQRVAMARALVNDPAVIFADEPTGNLDSKTGRMVMDLVAGLHEKGHTIIVITHETDAANYAQRIIRLQDGAIIEDQAGQYKNTFRK